MSNIDHPDHYHPGTYEAINVIEAWDLGFNLGNAVKYIARAGRKGARDEDLRKAVWYLERELAKGASFLEPPRPDLFPCIQCSKRLLLRLQPVGHRLWCSTSCQGDWRKARGLDDRQDWSREAGVCEVCNQPTTGKVNAGVMCKSCQEAHL